MNNLTFLKKNSVILTIFCLFGSVSCVLNEQRQNTVEIELIFLKKFQVVHGYSQLFFTLK